MARVGKGFEDSGNGWDLVCNLERFVVANPIGPCTWLSVRPIPIAFSNDTRND